jgi:hypothetical protein
MGTGVHIYRSYRGHRSDPKTSGERLLFLIWLKLLLKRYPIQLELTLDEIKWAIVAAKKLKIKHDVGSFI